jgi:hypothetical protein
MPKKHRKKGPKAAKRAAQAAARNRRPEPEPSMLDRVLPSSFGMSVEGDEHQRGTEHDLGSLGATKPEEAGSWWDYLPSFTWGGEESSGTQTRLDGDDDSHVDVLSNQNKQGLSLSMGATGVKGKAEYEKQMTLLEAAKKGTVGEETGLSASASTSVSVGKASAGAKGSISGDRSGISGDAEIGAGAYAMAAEASGELGIPIPWTNARLVGGMTAGGTMGVGGKAEGHFAYGSEGASMGGKLTGSVGLGGQLGWNAGIQKRDPNKEGWF